MGKSIKKFSKAIVLLFLLVVSGSFSVQAEAASKTADTLEKPVIRKIAATQKETVKLQWGKVKDASGYQIYRASSKKGTYRKIGESKKNQYTDKTGKPGRVYYYKIRAQRGEPSSEEYTESKYSKAVSKRVRKKTARTAYIGDSIMSGYKSYGMIKNTKKHRIYTKIGVNTSNFYKSGLMKSALGYKPDRVCIMLGVNGLGIRWESGYMEHILDYYEKIIQAFTKRNPTVEIIVMSVAPASRGAHIRLANIKRFNKKLKGRISRYENAYYYDLFPVLANSQGYLKPQYNGGDGIHWKKPAYSRVLENLKEFTKEL